MSAAVMTERIAEASPRFRAKIAGIFWLMTILTGAFALFVGGRFVVSGEAAVPAGRLGKRAVPQRIHGGTGAHAGAHVSQIV